MNCGILTQTGNQGYVNSEIRRSMDCESPLSTYTVAAEPLVCCRSQLPGVFQHTLNPTQEMELSMCSRDVHVSEEVQRSVAMEILNGIEALIDEAKSETKPLEVDPFRSRLFEMFVTADGANMVGDERKSSLNDDSHSDDETDMSADGLCRSLARRWGLDMAARDSAASQTKMPPEHVEKMRALWTVMRMWMEWNYAWCRWEEFHSAENAVVQ
jgi:hypothetical protein